MKKCLWTIGSLGVLTLSSPSSAEQLSQHLSTITDPSPVVRVPPKYPRKAAKSRREGWTRLSFVIGIDGKVSDVLVKESSGSLDFNRAAIRSVLQWQYEPAQENGQPIEQCANTVQLDFRMSKNINEPSVSRKFMRIYNQALEALEGKNYEQVQLLLTDMSELKYRHLTENNYLHILAFNYEKTQNNVPAQLHHLANITYPALPDKHQYALLKERFIIQVDANQFTQARFTYSYISKLDSAQAQLSLFTESLAKIDDLVKGDKNIVQAADMGELDFWYTSLVRNQFSLVNIEGSLHKLDVRCANKRHVFSVEKNNTWTIPSSWNNCSIYVYGDDNTRFNLVEHPEKA